MRRTVGILLILSTMPGLVVPASAKILKTRGEHPGGPGRFRELPLTVGSGLEYQTDGEETEYGIPFLIEYGLTEEFTLNAEPNYTVLQTKDAGTLSGLGDLETTAIFEFIRERRNRPALAAEGLIKWPTAAHPEFGSGRVDYSLGLIVSKEFVGFDTNLNAIYTLVGHPADSRSLNTLELSLAAEWHVSSLISLEGEIVTTSNAGGGFHGRPGTIGGGLGSADKLGRESETTLGVVEQLSHHLKLEQGMTLLFDGSWQAVAAWEWDFGEGK